MLRRKGTVASRRVRQPKTARQPVSATAADDHSKVVAMTKSTRVVYGHEPTHREVRDRAYYIYLARGSTNGDPTVDWLQAERELRQELGGVRSSGWRF